jgi:hypothetical protein
MRIESPLTSSLNTSPFATPHTTGQNHQAHPRVHRHEEGEQSHARQEELG